MNASADVHQCAERTVTVRQDRDGDKPPTFVILHYDQEILVSPELLDIIYANDPAWPATFDGEILTIRGRNQTLTYRIHGWLRPGNPARIPEMHATETAMLPGYLTGRLTGT